MLVPFTGVAQFTVVGGELVLVQVNWSTSASTFVGVKSCNETLWIMLGTICERVNSSIAYVMYFLSY